MNRLAVSRLAVTVRCTAARFAAPRPRTFAPIACNARNVRAYSGSPLQDLISGMESKIKQALDAQDVEVIDNNGDGRHVQIHVVSSAFQGKNAVQRQRLVYKVCRWWGRAGRRVAMHVAAPVATCRSMNAVHQRPFPTSGRLGGAPKHSACR